MRCAVPPDDRRTAAMAECAAPRVKCLRESQKCGMNFGLCANGLRHNLRQARRYRSWYGSFFLVPDGMRLHRQSMKGADRCSLELFSFHIAAGAAGQLRRLQFLNSTRGKPSVPNSGNSIRSCGTTVGQVPGGVGCSALRSSPCVGRNSQRPRTCSGGQRIPPLAVVTRLPARPCTPPPLHAPLAVPAPSRPAGRSRTPPTSARCDPDTAAQPQNDPDSSARP